MHFVPPEVLSLMKPKRVLEHKNLAYYNVRTTNIPSYSVLFFIFFENQTLAKKSNLAN